MNMNRKEFETVLLSNSCFEFWIKKNKNEVANLLGQDVANMVNFNQDNPHHCYNLFEHSLRVVENCRSLGDDRDVLLLTAGFYHDIGKITTVKRKKDRLVFYGHAKESSKIADKILNEMGGYSSEDIDVIKFYIKYHDLFISYVLPEEDYDKTNNFLKEINVYNVCNEIDAINKTISYEHWFNVLIWKKLMLLCRADIEAQSEFVIQNGKVIDSKEHKLKKIVAIESIIKNNL